MPSTPRRHHRRRHRACADYAKNTAACWPTACTRPAELDCRFETLCEGCGFFATTIEFKPTLTRQRDHAAAHDQPARAGIYQHLLATSSSASTFASP
jgi:hypothetical protein